MALEDIIKYIGLTVEGKGYAGKIEEYNAPDLGVAMEGVRAGGMDTEVDVDMGMDKMTCSFVLVSYDDDVLALFGVTKGSGFNCTVRGSMENLDGTTKPVKHEMRGKIVSIARGTWGSGNKPSLTINMTLRTYKETHGDRVLFDIDAVNMKRIIDGVDQLAEHRANIGL